MTTRQRQIVFWLLAFVGFLLFLHVFRRILLPFVAGMALAYLLDPVASWIERRGVGRLTATIIILFLFVVLFVLALVIVVPILINQLTALISQVPAYVDSLQSLFDQLLDSKIAKYFGIDSMSIGTSLRGMLGQGATLVTKLLGSVLSSGLALLDILSLLLITPVVAFYLLIDWSKLTAYIDALLPRDNAQQIRDLCSEMGARIAAFVRGQRLICLILAILYGAGLALAGISFGFLVGVSAGILSFIPYVGTAVGLLGSVGLGLAQFWPDWTPAMIAFVIFILGQIVSDYFLTPKLLGENVGLHPVWVIFSFFAFGSIFGFLGLIIAIPAAAAIGVLVRYFIDLYLDSQFYLGRARKAKE
ncbi:MAG: AI-2E family transporter [Rhizobiales bacterium]|nr:AI-2E family transporter [Hyphomicrobiales bacterium]